MIDHSRFMVAVACIAALAPLSACVTPPTPSEIADTPPVVLTPITQTQIIDDRARFRVLFCRLLHESQPQDASSRDCGFWLYKLGNEPDPSPSASVASPVAPRLRLVILPGIFGECVQNSVTVFGDALANLKKIGYRSTIIPVRGRASSHYNAKIIRDEILKLEASEPGQRLLLIGYSKGVPDGLEAIVEYPVIRPYIAGFLSIAGVVNGTPLADRGINIYDDTIGKLPFSACPIIDEGELSSLTRTERLPWLASHPLPPKIAYFSLVTMPAAGRISRVLKPLYDILATVDARNDSQVIYYDAIIPRSHLLGYVNADHWAVALPFQSEQPLIAETLADQNDFPRAQLLQAAVEYAEEVIGAQHNPPQH